ncbi:MAG: polyamine aminopropyltransferase [Myxococcales bacterium]|nr:polyamine aminopropyltransferase [Myxococcales bacterium]MCB9520327.1 polyamine aminopropyltransferase [Myxococcales bacterium]MCB9530992.1 polyamine aminopropyltransferase [Myxococcales bacterium]MCB9532912.1 polyamine aminopropyltransferase [Myxococcales bacterium]
MLRYDDPWARGTFLSYTVTKVYEMFETEFQRIEVFEAEEFGTVLALGGVTNVTDRDESAYHELLAHLPLLCHPNPRRVLIIGGGDGGTLREVLRHPEVQEAVLVDIDGEVIRCAKQYFPKLAVAFEDPRADVRVADGVAFVANAAAAGEKFDVILVDSTDPVDAAVDLFTESFYRGCATLLGDSGILVPQSDSLTFCIDRVVGIHRNLSAIFGSVTPYAGHCLTYPGAYWAFMGATNGRALSPEHVDGKRLAAFAEELRFINEPHARAVFALPQYVVRALAGAPPSDLPSVCDVPPVD